MERMRTHLKSYLDCFLYVFLYTKLWLWEHLHLERPRMESKPVISIHVLEVDLELSLGYKYYVIEYTNYIV